ncbi:MAG: hypothetical protein ABI266_01350 [Ginsengibacter sp.]
MLKKPILAKCCDRNSMPKTHPTSGSPEDWFSKEILAKHNLSGISFDFFVNWHLNPPSITPIIWIKRILSSQYSYPQAIANIKNTLVKEFGEKQLEVLKAFAKNNHFKIQFIIFKDELYWKDRASEILIVNFKIDENEQFIFDTLLITMDEFETTIRNHSGGSVQIGSKGLIYGTSNLECYLSHTNSLYPGDADMIILDENCKSICILEFKKHTLNSSIESQQLANYYPDPDGRKYNRLAILKEYLKPYNANIPLLNIYYPTRSHFKEGRLELLKGSADNLSTKAASNFALPDIHSIDGFNSIIEKVKRAISYHHSLQ